MTTTFNAATTKTVNVNGTNLVYREIGDKSGVPVVFLHHLTAVLEDWDPAIPDGLAKSHPVIVFDNRGVGGSEGKTPDTVADMAKDAIAFIDALGLAKVDLFGFSLGVSMAETNCAKWRRESVPVGLREKGFEARCYFCFFSTDLDFGGRISFVWCFWILAMPVS